MQREHVTPPVDIVSAAKVVQQLGGARLPQANEIIEPLRPMRLLERHTGLAGVTGVRE
jgi:hypothetical protein